MRSSVIVASGRDQYVDNGNTFVRPGESGSDWTEARRLAKERNYQPPQLQYSEHYHVSSLLKLTSGYDATDLWAQMRMLKTHQTQNLPQLKVRIIKLGGGRQLKFVKLTD